METVNLLQNCTYFRLDSKTTALSKSHFSTFSVKYIIYKQCVKKNVKRFKNYLSLLCFSDLFPSVISVPLIVFASGLGA